MGFKYGIIQDMKKELSEPARQFAQIYKDHHDPEMREKRKIINNRVKRQEDKKKDLGL